MDYSLLVGVHNADRTGDESFLPVPDQKRNQGQKPLYCTTMEAIQGEVKGKDAPQYSERLDTMLPVWNAFILYKSLCCMLVKTCRQFTAHPGIISASHHIFSSLSVDIMWSLSCAAVLYHVAFLSFMCDCVFPSLQHGRNASTQRKGRAVAHFYWYHWHPAVLQVQGVINVILLKLLLNHNEFVWLIPLCVSF